MNQASTFNPTQEERHSSFQRFIAQRQKAPTTDAPVTLPGILFITSYPPRECGIATYSQDLMKAMTNKFKDSFSMMVCALESGNHVHDYPEEVKYTLDTGNPDQYLELARSINANKSIQSVVLQHEFGFFQQAGTNVLLQFLCTLSKPTILVFHTVLPNPNGDLKWEVQRIVAACDSIIVMTQNAAQILVEDYQVAPHKIEVIAHGTHLVPHLNKGILKEKYGLSGKKVLATFGLLGSGKAIETTLNALPAVIAEHPDTIFLLIGKTHPGVVKAEGETYRTMLEEKVMALQLQHHVRFINRYLPLADLLEYLQLTDIYLFTSKDPNQAVSGTFSYALSCGCPIISTPIPHAKEVLNPNNGIIIEFQSSTQLAAAVNRLMSDDHLRNAFISNTLQQILPTAWENSAIAHAKLLQKVGGQVPPVTKPAVPPHRFTTEAPTRHISLQYRRPEINLEHVKKMTTEFGMLQFSIINQPDMNSGYTLDDNARALIALVMHYEHSQDPADLPYIETYLNFIRFCQLPAGDFENYVDIEGQFTAQNRETNLSDSNGRALWALGFLVSKSAILPSHLVETASTLLEQSTSWLATTHSTRSMAFAIKGLYLYNQHHHSASITAHITTLANRLVQMYLHESEPEWQWFEAYMTYGNAILPEALLCAYQETGSPLYQEIARQSFDFLLTVTFKGTEINVISNQSWLQKGATPAKYGEQPIDVAYTILALERFYAVFEEKQYAQKMTAAFNWFLGKNHLHQIVYNPCTGGCYDGLEQYHVNLNQGAESTLSYLMARLVLAKFSGKS